MFQEPIYHITRRRAWDEAEQGGRYAPCSLEQEGFIHFSTRDQVIATANRFYQGQQGLVVLVVDPRTVEADLKYEAAVDGAGVFPHLYAPLDVSAVSEVLEFPCAADGTFPSPFHR